MALVESVKVPLGTLMPKFNLKDSEGQRHDSNKEFGERGLLVVFTCNHCPYAQAVWPRLIRLSRHARQFEINTVAINPNINPDYPDDAPDKMQERIKQWGIDFPYLIDDTQRVAKSFKAQCTPDIYLFNSQQELIYHGRMDDNWQDENNVTREELKEAINNYVAGLPVDQKQRPSMGCSIKWRPSST
jgi:peroxiredoxin